MPFSLKNYHRVSNFPFIFKLLEKLVLQQLKMRVSDNNLLHPFQSAYSSSHSTETVLLHTVNDSLLAADSGEVSLLTLLDLSAAFDTTDHPFLLTRLEYTFGIHNTPLPGSSTVCTTGSKQYLSTTCSPILSNFPVVSLKVLS